MDLPKLRGLDLFSGIGGLSLALEPWVETVAYCEQDLYAQGVLLSRMLEGDLDAAPIWDDVCSLRGKDLPTIDIIFGGFPCQDLSTAGRGAGLEGKRSGLFFEICRLIDETKPTFVFLENVPAIRSRGLHTVIEELSSRGFQCRWTCLSAQEIGAPHKRDRWFLLAYSDSSPWGEWWIKHSRQEETREPSVSSEKLADSVCEGLERQRLSCGISEELLSSDSSCETSPAGWWEVEPSVGRLVDELPFRMDQLKCLGNAVVPLQAQEAFKELLGLKGNP